MGRRLQLSGGAGLNAATCEPESKTPYHPDDFLRFPEATDGPVVPTVEIRLRAGWTGSVQAGRHQLDVGFADFSWTMVWEEGHSEISNWRQAIGAEA